jgi:hypothetical protein
MIRLAMPHLRGETFVIKTHNRPSQNVRRCMKLGMIRATYIYRDPRDVVLSALDHGAKIRQNGEQHTFGNLLSTEDSIRYVKGLLTIWDEWMATGKTHCVRYEDLLSNPLEELCRLRDFLELRVGVEQLRRIVETYRGDQLSDEGVKGSLHFNQGISGRYKEVMSQSELGLCNQHFSSYLQRMGYAA